MKNVRLKFDNLKLGLGEWSSRELYASYAFTVLLLLCVGWSIVLMQWFYAFGTNTFSVGSPSPRTFMAISPLNYADGTTTDRLRNLAGESVTGVLVRDAGAHDRMKSRLSEFRKSLEASPREDEGEEVLSRELTAAFRNVSEDQAEILLIFANRIGDLYFAAMTSGDLAVSGQDKAMLWTEIDKLGLPSGESNLLYQLMSEVTDSSVKMDARMTHFVRNIVRNSISPVERRLEVGDVIAERDQMITPQIGDLLRLQGYMEDTFPLDRLIVVCLLALVLPLWLEIPARENSSNRPTWSCIVFVIGSGWICQTAAVHLNALGAGILASATAAYLCMPRRFAFNVCLAGMASGVFLITGLSVSNMLFLLLVGFVVSMSSFYILRKVESRERLVYQVFLLVVFLTVVKVIFLGFQGMSLMGNSFGFSWRLWRLVVRFLFFDIVTTFLMISLLPLIEGYIGALSPLRTRELSHPSSPLLRKLQVEAPGTYHHCLMIGTLAEAVAKELGLDENLMKVGAYYHDIGKLRRPRYFVENQMGGENIHDTISPTLSTVAIIAHVREGVELANEFGLPKKVKQFIVEHHGTTSLSYFYKKALALGEKVELAQFCYPGPKPQSRETALLMLLDSLEAAMRAESRNIATVLDIQQVIDRVIAIKVADKQFDEVDFTFKEMARIKEALLKAFQSMYHTRTVKEIKEVKD